MTAPVKGVSVTLVAKTVVATFDDSGSRKTRKVAVTVPKVQKSVCRGAQNAIGIARVHWDDTAPWIVVDVVVECASQGDDEAPLHVPVPVDLR